MKFVQLVIFILYLAINEIFGEAGFENVQGETVQNLDVISNIYLKFGNDHFINELKKSGSCCGMVSEEEEEIILVDEDDCGPFICSFDPLDGSSNIDIAIPIGSIFAVYEKISEGKQAKQIDFFQKGKNIFCSGYAMYGSCTMMILATNNGVNGFTLNPISGDFELTSKNLKVPNKGSIYSVNEGNFSSWLDITKKICNVKKRIRKTIFFKICWKYGC